MSGAPDWLADPALELVWDRIRSRLEATGGTAVGRILVGITSRQERHALGDLLGTNIVKERATLDLASLEQRIVERTGFASLADATETVTGRPLRNRPREREEQALRRSAPLDLARTLAEGPWVEPWLAGLSRSGVLTRAPDGAALMSDAVHVLEEVLAHTGVPRSRVELAARVVGDAHALDENSLLHLVLLRGLAAAAATDVPTTLTGRRALWESFGVSADQLSATCLSVGLRPSGEGALARRLRMAAESGDPVHVTAWDLRRRDDAAVDVGQVLVCENPRVLEAVAERFGGDVSTVCTSGQPNTVVTELLAWLGRSCCRLRYHGDFDWPGIAIANWLVAQRHVTPWRMGVADYESGLRPGSPRLEGTHIEPCWNAELGAAMRTRGFAVHEESVLEQLLDSLHAGF